MERYGFSPHVMFVMDRQWIGHEDFGAYVRHEIAHGAQARDRWYVEPTAMVMAEQPMHKDRPMHDIGVLWYSTLLREHCVSHTDATEFEACRDETARGFVREGMSPLSSLSSETALLNIRVPESLVPEMGVKYNGVYRLFYSEFGQGLASETVSKLQRTPHLAKWIRFLTEAGPSTEEKVEVTITSGDHTIEVRSSDGRGFTQTTELVQDEREFTYAIEDPAMLDTVKFVLNYSPEKTAVSNSVRRPLNRESALRTILGNSLNVHKERKWLRGVITCELAMALLVIALLRYGTRPKVKKGLYPSTPQ